MEDKWLRGAHGTMHAYFAPSRAGRRLPPVVLVCGLGVSARYMIPAALELAREREVYCPELPGFGQSSKPVHVLNIPELADSLADFFAAAGIRRANLVGHSFGCQIAVEFALRHPEKTGALVLAAPTGDPRVRSAIRYVGRLLLDAPREPVSLVAMAVGDYLRAGPARVWRTLKISLRDRMEEKLPLVGAPALVIRGSRDAVVSQQWTERVAGLLPAGKLLIIDRAPHAAHYRSPERFAAAVRGFFADQIFR